MAIKEKKDYLIGMFRGLLEAGIDFNILEELHDSDMRFEYAGYSADEAKQETLNKYRRILLRDNNIVDTIVRFDDVYGILILDADGNTPPTNDEEQRYFSEFVNWLTSQFCDYNFTVVDGELYNDPDGFVKEMREVFIAHKIVQHLIREREYRESQLRRYDNLTDKSKTKADRLGGAIVRYGFLDLPDVVRLSDKGQLRLIELIANNSVPYAIAMFELVNFINHLQRHHFTTKINLYKTIANWFGVNEREIKGNILVLNEKSKEDLTRYVSCDERDKVKKDFKELK